VPQAAQESKAHMTWALMWAGMRALVDIVILLATPSPYGKGASLSIGLQALMLQRSESPRRLYNYTMASQYEFCYCMTLGLGVRCLHRGRMVCPNHSKGFQDVGSLDQRFRGRAVGQGCRCRSL
jgi:hypothetical protein